MAFLKNGTGVAVGLGLGVGAAVLAKGVVPMLKESGRPLAKAAIKSGIVFFERIRESLARLAEEVEDIVAEAEAEVKLEADVDKDEAPPARTAPSKRAKKKTKTKRTKRKTSKTAEAGA